MAYQRILLKLSGEALMGTQASGIAPDRLAFYAAELAQVHANHTSISIVVGGGNFWRGAQTADVPRVQSDSMGMQATVMNGLALQSALAQQGVRSSVLSSIAAGPACEPYSPTKARQRLAQDEVVICTGGLGIPYFTTDSAASIRALEVGAEVLLKGTRVDGVYTADPQLDPEAERIPKLTFQEAYERKLRVMDMTAFTLCADNRLPVIVFSINQAGHLASIVQGASIGTLLHV